MSTIGRIAILAAMLPAIACPALAMSGEELLRSCEILLRDGRTGPGPGDTVAVPSGGRPCWFYMSAIQDASTLGDEANRPLLRFCAPPESTLMQYIRIFVDHARRNPAQLHESGARISQLALNNAFPCR